MGSIANGKFYQTIMRSLNVQNVVDLKPVVLLVDDEAFNLEILEELLDDCGYQTDSAENGREACELLQANPEKYQAVLLDRMMPVMGGIEVTHFMRQDPRLSMIPVIMQTAKATRQDIEEGLEAGILYYLTKPFAKNELLSIVDTAVRYFYECQELRHELNDRSVVLPDTGNVQICTLDEAREAATRLANLADDPARVVVGLLELFVNAIEHGNLGIGYECKSGLKESGEWLKEVERRLRLPENAAKRVSVDYRIVNGVLRFTVSDEGKGFNYREFFEINTTKNLNIHGRGIAIARVFSFDNLRYVAPGNQVVAETKAGAARTGNER